MKGRVTKSKLLKWFSIKFKELEIHEYEVFDIIRTRYTSDHYEGGAAKLIIRFRSKTNPNILTGYGSFLCFYSMGELTDYLNSGYRLYIKSDPRYPMLSNFELDVTKY